MRTLAFICGSAFIIAMALFLSDGNGSGNMFAFENVKFSQKESVRPETVVFNPSLSKSLEYLSNNPADAGTAYIVKAVIILNGNK